MKYELIGAAVGAAGALAGTWIGSQSQFADFWGAALGIASFAGAGVFVGRHVGETVERAAAARLFRRFLKDAGCNVTSSPAWFVQQVVQRLFEDEKAFKRAGISPTFGYGGRKLTAYLHQIAELVAYAMDPQDPARDVVSEPDVWQRYRGFAVWVIPLLDGGGIPHRFEWPKYDKEPPLGNADQTVMAAVR